MRASAKPPALQGRPNQKSRTRKDLLQAASRLMGDGRKPSLEEVAETAMVSRATAYRYFPSIDALLAEAALELAAPTAEQTLKDAPPEDPVARLEKVDAAFQRMMESNETLLRLMLAGTLQHRAANPDSSTPVRQNRRSALIEAALAPSADEFKPADLKLLQRALGVVIGTEGFIALKDVLQLDEADARKVRRWMIRALVDAARR